MVVFCEMRFTSNLRVHVPPLLNSGSDMQSANNLVPASNITQYRTRSHAITCFQTTRMLTTWRLDQHVQLQIIAFTDF